MDIAEKRHELPLEDSLRIDTAINMIDDVPQESASEVFATARTLHPSIRIADYQPGKVS